MIQKKKLAEYVPYFNDEFIGVTGNKHLIPRLTAELNVAYNQVPLDTGDYTVDHSTQLVLINPKGHYHGFFKASTVKLCCEALGVQLMEVAIFKAVDQPIYTGF